MQEQRRFAAVALLAVLTGGASWATTLLELGFPDLARQADRIVIGTVTWVEGRWDPTHRFIHSDVTLSVEQTLRGDPSPEVVLRTIGGTVGGVGQMAHGAATFEAGERVLVFLTRWEDGALKVLGYQQGKSRIVSDEHGQQRLQGGSADGRHLPGVIRELRDGPEHNVPLRPSRRAGS